MWLINYNNIVIKSKEKQNRPRQTCPSRDCILIGQSNHCQCKMTTSHSHLSSSISRISSSTSGVILGRPFSPSSTAPDESSKNSTSVSEKLVHSLMAYTKDTCKVNSFFSISYSFLFWFNILFVTHSFIIFIFGKKSTILKKTK